MRAALDSEAERNRGDGFESSERWLREAVCVGSLFSPLARQESSSLESRSDEHECSLGLQRGMQEDCMQRNAKAFFPLRWFCTASNIALRCTFLP